LPPGHEERVAYPEATVAAPLARPLISRRTRDVLTGYAYLIPAAVCLGGTIAFPILKAIHMSLYRHVLFRPQEYGFIGLGNYGRLLRDEVFWLTLWNSFIWVAGSVSLQFLGGFAAALLLHQAFRGRALVRTVTLLPWVIPGVVVALVWEWLYQPNYGVINDLLLRLGLLTERVAWLSDPALAMPAVIATNVWRGVPFFAIMLLAGLQAIPDELYEAALVDGASVLHRFWHITLPLLRPIIVVATATRIVWTFNYADLIFVMTSGGPANATQITSTYTLLQAYSDLDFGYAATLSVVLLVIMLVFTTAYLRVTRGIESVA
jgi:multiple sugar transport system permease protein